MFNPFTLLWRGIRWLIGLILPMLTRPKLSPTTLWVLHFLALAGVLFGLWYLHQRLNLDRFVPVPWLQDYWLPLLFLLMYLLAWQAWWLWELLRAGGEASAYPDLDRDWAGALEALYKAGIDPQETPIFLVLGRLEAPEESVFQALPQRVAVAGAPGPGASLRVFANRDAIYLTCAGASLSGAQASAQGGLQIADEVDEGTGWGAQSVGIDKSIGMSMADDGAVRQVQQIIRRAREEGRTLTEQEKQQIRVLSGGPAQAQPAAGPRPSVLKDVQAVAYHTARLRHLCRLLRRTRGLLCPINGTVLLISAAVADRDEDAQQLAVAMQKDLMTLQEELRLLNPVHALVGDLERLEGFDEFVGRFPVEKREQRLGKGTPLIPDLHPQAVPEEIEKTVRWIFRSLLPFWVFKLFRPEQPNLETPRQAAAANGRLFRFLTEVEGRGERLARLLSRAVVLRPDLPPMLGG
ncbi:MAG TPA: type VI secretion protein IcmF/TssM N-terminal domain-containing protein, partial [Gemmataceae bacterium]